MTRHRFNRLVLGLCVLLLIGCGAQQSLANPTVGMSGPNAIAIHDFGGAVSPVVVLDRTKVLVGSEEELQLLLRFDVPVPVRDRQDRMPLNLTLVIDRSGSMADKNKITHARAAALLLVDAMSPSDFLGVVEYDDKINVLWPSSPLTSPATVKRLIAGLEPRGATDLAGGLMRGLEEVSRHARPDAINRVLLLSDGLANRGITHPREIARFVREARRRGLTVSTLGLGLEYNEDLMQSVAEVGGGNYYYVESPAQMAGIFEQELSTLFATVAQDVHLHITVTRWVRSLDVVGYEVNRNGADAVVDLENLYGGEQRTVLLRLRVKADEPGPIDLGSLAFAYTDRQEGKPVRLELCDLAVDATESPQAVAASRDDKVSAEALLMTADEEHEQYVKQYESGQKDEALVNVTALSQRLQDANATYQDERLDKKMEQLRMESDEMHWADLNEQNRQSYLKGSKERFYQAKRGKRGKYMLQENDTGYEVRQLQARLTDLGLYTGPVNGEYNVEVARAVSEYQRTNGLTVDGIAGPATLRSLSLY
jgi:Ca-activated chloride channel family protein